MKIVQVSILYDEQVPDQESLLEAHYTITGWAEALQRRGAQVTVISRFREEGEWVQNEVRYLFHKDKLGGILHSRQIPWSFLDAISRLDADIIHLHNLSFSLQTFLLRRKLKRDTAIVVQHHGGISPSKWKRRVHNLLNGSADGYFFTTVEQGQDWLMSKNRRKIFPLMEGATFFKYADRDRSKPVVYRNRDEVRKRTGLKGDPVLLWVGRLDENKDPLTVLDGMEIFLQQHREASLCMIYSDDRLAGRVQKKLGDTGLLQNKVQLVKNVPHEAMQEYYESADYFVLGSHYEGSGYALSEALSCGCIPVVTNIPSFRMMTREGKLGALWEPDNKNSFVLALHAAMNKQRKAEAQACMDFFRDQLSFDAIAEKAMQHYAAIISRRR